MGCPVFGGVSSPSCSNCALKKTVDDNKLTWNCWYGLEAANLLNKSLYVDEMLMSVGSIPEAITLVKMLKACSKLVVLD